MKDYNLGIMQPNEEREVNAFGDYLRNIGTGSIKVVARNTEKSVKSFDSVLGSGGWRSPESTYNHWVVKNNSSVAIAVSVLIGKGEAGESNVQINADVNAIIKSNTISLKRVEEDQNVFGIYLTGAAKIGEYGFIQVGLPAGSSRRCLVESCVVSSPSSEIDKTVATGMAKVSNVIGGVQTSNHYHAASKLAINVQGKEGSAAAAVTDRALGLYFLGYEPFNVVAKDSPVLLESNAVDDSFFFIKTIATQSTFTAAIVFRELL
jgi:hypothetical protein